MRCAREIRIHQSAESGKSKGKESKWTNFSKFRLIPFFTSLVPSWFFNSRVLLYTRKNHIEHE